MICKRHDHNIALYASGDLSPRASRKLELHLESCPRCRQSLTMLSEVQTILHGSDANSIESLQLEEFRSSFNARLAETQVKESKSRFPWRRLAYVTTAFLLFIGIAGFNTYRSPQEAQSVQETPREQISAPAAQPRQTEPITIQIATDNPNIVIYWLADSRTGVS